MPSPSDPLGLILFDFDGTLCDSAATISRILRQSCDRLGIEVPSAEVIRGHIGQGMMHLAMHYTKGDAARAQDLFTTYRKIAAAELKDTSRPKDPLFAGADQILQRLSAAGWLVGIVTNKSRLGLDSLLAYHGLDTILDVSTTIDEFAGKPAPDMIIGAMDRLGVAPQHTLLVGDTEVDAGAAKNAKVEFIGVSWGYHEVSALHAAGARAILESYDGLPALLEDWWQEVVK